MTPKEKAEDLIDSYYILIDGFVPFEQVKNCALIAVDLILTEHPMAHDYFYWLEVKQEIEAL